VQTAGTGETEEELANVLADVRRGMWRPDERPDPQAPDADPGFHRFASEWLAAVSAGLAPKTVGRYRWQLVNHLLPYFAGYRLREIDVATVDRYREGKVREGRLSADTINGTLTRLGQILDVADERGLIDRPRSGSTPGGGSSRRRSLAPSGSTGLTRSRLSSPRRPSSIERLEPIACTWGAGRFWP
jgi:Phage integrase, N-terminal SAM-like domain